MNNAYASTNWIPTARECARSIFILSYVYKQYGNVLILVNDNGNLIAKTLKELWMIPDSFVKSGAYPKALENSNSFSNTLIKDYGPYGFRESKIANMKKKLITEKKKILLSK